MRDTVDGLVIGEVASGENDKRITVLTARDGKVSFLAKGARSIRSKVVSVCRLFTYGNFEYYEKNGIRWLSGGSAEQSFFELTADITDFALASYFATVASEISGEGVEADELLRLCLNSLYAISKKLKPREQIKACFELYAAKLSGFLPDLSLEGEIKEGDGFVWLDVMNGRLSSGGMSDRAIELGMRDNVNDADMTANILLPLDATSLAAMRYILSAPLKRLFAFGMTDGESMRLLSRAAETYLLNHLERSFDSLDFYKTLKD